MTKRDLVRAGIYGGPLVRAEAYRGDSPQKARDVQICCRFVAGKLVPDIAAEFGISPARVIQITGRVAKIADRQIKQIENVKPLLELMAESATTPSREASRALKGDVFSWLWDLED